MNTVNRIDRNTLAAAIEETARTLFPKADALRAELAEAERAAADANALAARMTAAALADSDDRAAKVAAKTARNTARAADDAADALRAKLALMDADALTRRADIVAAFRERTAADDAADDARKAYAAARDEWESAGTPESRKAMQTAKAACKAADALAEAAAADAPRYAFTIGAPAVNERYPASALRAAYIIIQKYAARAGIAIADTFAAWDIFTDDAAAVMRSARVVAKRAALNCVMRQGTPTQWSMYNAACAGDWEQQDISDIQQAAALALWESIADAPADDSALARADALRAARKGAFIAVNEYLSSMRAIRADAHAARDIPLESIADNTPAPADDSEYRARRADIIRRADSIARENLTPAEKRALAALVRMGGNEHAAARLLRVHHKTVQQTRARIAGKYAAAVDAVAGDSIELHALTLAAITAELDGAVITINRADDSALAAIVADLPPAQRRAAILIGRGATYRAAADVLGRDFTTIARACSRAADALKNAYPAARDMDIAALLKIAVRAYDAAQRAAE